MNITFQKIRWLMLLSVMLLSMAVHAETITIDGVEYTRHASQSVDVTTQIVLGEVGQNNYYEFKNSTIPATRERTPKRNSSMAGSIKRMGNTV